MKKKKYEKEHNKFGGEHCVTPTTASFFCGKDESERNARREKNKLEFRGFNPQIVFEVTNVIIYHSQYISN